uniref:Breast carcinoma-amplified sequence 1 n=2 Tax=Callorhinchus milii TaxID=7868 RepID=A0A4W3IYF1_CALMI
MSSKINADGKGLGKPAKKTETASKSIFGKALSHNVLKPNHGNLKEPLSEMTNQNNTAMDTAPVDNWDLREVFSQKQSPIPKPEQISAETSPAVELPKGGSPKEEAVTQPKQKEIGFFEKLFKQGDKGKGAAKENQQESKETESPDAATAEREATEVLRRLDNVQQVLNEGDKDSIRPSHVDNASQSPVFADSSVTENPNESEDKRDKGANAETFAEENPVMNFFKTLVSPTKSPSKIELEPQHAGEEEIKSNGETKEGATKASEPTQPELQQEVPESQAKPKPVKEPSQNPFGKLFKSKAAKEAPQNVEQQNIGTTVNSETSATLPHPQIETSKREMGPGPDEKAKPQRCEEEEVKPAKKGFLHFFKHMDSDATDGPGDKSPTSASGDTAKKGKDNQGQRKSSAESSQEQQKTMSMEVLPPAQQQNAILVPTQNGEEVKPKEASEKKLDKRHSFGGFLKTLGGKKTADVGVQTDPVSIYPAGKAK